MQMKKINRILLTVIVTVLTVGITAMSALLIWQFENISAFVIALMYEEEHIDTMVGEAHQEIKDVMQDDNLKPPRAATEEENKAYTSGEITMEQFTMILTGQTTLEEIREQKKETEQLEHQPEQQPEQKPTEQKPTEQKPTEQKPTEQKPNEQKPTQQQPEQKPAEQKPNEEKVKDYDTLISEKVAEMYAIKANYYAEFNDYWAKAKEEFLARPVEEHTQENVAKVVKDNMDKGFAMEDRYDAQIEVVLSELTELLKASGKNTDLVEAIRNAYVAEKKAEKARIVKKYFG